jgi:hypothetical protein
MLPVSYKIATWFKFRTIPVGRCKGAGGGWENFLYQHTHRHTRADTKLSHLLKQQEDRTENPKHVSVTKLGSCVMYGIGRVAEDHKITHRIFKVGWKQADLCTWREHKSNDKRFVKLTSFEIVTSTKCFKVAHSVHYSQFIVPTTSKCTLIFTYECEIYRSNMFRCQ